jgi:hypothetical protein
MENEPDTEKPARRSVIEQIFHQLPPLGSQEYLELLKIAPPADLPAEVLVRAYRQLPLGSAAGRATLDRLVGRTESRWHYLGFVAWLARQQFDTQATQDRATEYEDLMQDAITRIIEVLHGPRGAYGETSWTVFCSQQFRDVWRRRYGRRKGTKLKRLAAQRISPTPPGEDERNTIYDLATDKSLWPTILDAGRSKRIETIAQQVMASLDDPLARQVAQALWSGERPKTSGSGTAAAGPSLMQQFPGKSRDQLNRLIQRLDSTLAAALLADKTLEWPPEEEMALLRKCKGAHK